MLVKFSWAAVLVLALAGCAGDDAAPTEPVDNGGGGGTPAIPDAPGDGGEAAEKPAGAGQAGEAAAAKAKAKAAPAAPGERIVATGALNVRSGPSMDSAVVRVLPGGERIKPISCEKGWCKLAEGEFVGEKNLK